MRKILQEKKILQVHFSYRILKKENSMQLYIPKGLGFLTKKWKVKLKCRGKKKRKNMLPGIDRNVILICIFLI